MSRSILQGDPVGVAKKCDILVIGAGPAGSTAAFLLASYGFEVILVDKHSFPRPKLCAGLLTWKTIRLIHSIFNLTSDDLVEHHLVCNQTRDYRIYHKASQIAHGRLDDPFHLIDRPGYDYFWLQKAADAGAHIITGLCAQHVAPDTGCATLADGSVIRAKTIIGADGVWSVARQAIFNTARHKALWKGNLAMTMETWSACADLKPVRSCAALYFGFVPWGYAWSFPRRDHSIVGIAALRRNSGRPLVKGFDAFLDAIGLNRQNLHAVKGYPLPMGNFVVPPGAGRVLLAGDACGLADPLLGEGIYYAHRSAQIAAHSIIATSPGHNQLSRTYHHALDQWVLRDLRWIRIFRNLLFAGGRRRKFRGLKTVLRYMPKRLEDAIQGRRSFAALLWPRSMPKPLNSHSINSAHP